MSRHTLWHRIVDITGYSVLFYVLVLRPRWSAKLDAWRKRNKQKRPADWPGE